MDFSTRFLRTKIWQNAWQVNYNFPYGFSQDFDSKKAFDDLEEIEAELGEEDNWVDWFAVSAKTIGLDKDALWEAVGTGRILAQVAEARDVKPQKVIDAIVAAETEAVEKAIAEGWMSRDEADTWLAELPTTWFVEESWDSDPGEESETWWEQIRDRASVVPWSLSVVWREGGLMLLGMALYQWGVLTAKRSRAFYGWLALIGFGLGLPMVGYGVINSLNGAAELAVDPNEIGSVFVALGYIAMVMFIAKLKFFSQAVNWFAPVGRMALTNYIMQSVICTTIFYGYGFGLQGKLDRVEQLLVVGGVWLFQLVVSPIWLRHFRFGPMEWVWRSLSYGKWQPMRRQPVVKAL